MDVQLRPAFGQSLEVVAILLRAFCVVAQLPGQYRLGQRIGARRTAAQMAAEQGLILVDTKYEFGQKDGQIYLIDEVHTPDSSRYFYADTYQEYQEKKLPQRQLSKEFVREWLIENGFQGKDGQKVPEMTDEKVMEISTRYIELYEKVTGETFFPANQEGILARVENNIRTFMSHFKR